ncbi:MAG: ATP-binding cassette domain-containing protein [Vulcanimicrobiaceae bacterium]
MIARGVVTAAAGSLVEARIPLGAVGDGVAIAGTHAIVHGTIAALHPDRVTIAPHGGLDGITAGTIVYVDPAAVMMPLGLGVLGRAFDARGCALDGGGALRGKRMHVGGESLSPAERAPVSQPLWTGVRAIDGLMTIARGARVGVFGPPGAGKSTLLQMLARGARADAVVVGLIGERGREAEAWIRNAGGRTTIVCATNDRPAAERARAARVALAQAHALRERGLHVLVILDSLARFGSALREIAVAAGESTGRGGYPASVFASLAQLVEIGGSTVRGSITLLATVLSESDGGDPLGDAARSLLDGHVVLSTPLAHAGRFPAIDMPASVSRTMLDVVTPAHAAHARVVRAAAAALAQSAEARTLGIMPVDPFVLRAVALEERLERFFRQDGSPLSPRDTAAELARLADNLEGNAWTSAPI